MKKLVMFLAVAGVFASCKPEAIETAFEVNPAEAIIEVSVVDVNTLQEVAAADYNLVSTAGDVNEAKDAVSIKGNKALAETDVTLTVVYKGAPYERTMHINALRAGGKANYSVVMVVGVPVGDAVIKVDEGSRTTSSQKYYFVPTSGHAHMATHDGINWATNMTEFMLEVTYDYKSMTGAKASDVNYSNTDFKNIVDSYASAMDNYAEEDKTDSFTVSAWAFYTICQTVTREDYVVSILADDNVVGQFSVTEYSNSVEEVEMANPYGHGHYEQGHGHDDGHGNYPNAGGGIVYGE